MKPVIINKPKSMKVAQDKKKSIDAMWPAIMNWCLENKGTTDDELYTYFGSRTEARDQKHFTNLCNRRGLKELRRTVNGKKELAAIKDTRQLTDEAIATFSKERRRRGMMHLGKMDAHMDIIHEALDVKSLHLKDDPDKKGLSSHIDDLGRAHKLAKDVYAIDAETAENKLKVNLAIITNFNPSEATIEI